MLRGRGAWADARSTPVARRRARWPRRVEARGDLCAARAGAALSHAARSVPAIHDRSDTKGTPAGNPGKGYPGRRSHTRRYRARSNRRRRAPRAQTLNASSTTSTLSPHVEPEGGADFRRRWRWRSCKKARRQRLDELPASASQEPPGELIHARRGDPWSGRKMCLGPCISGGQGDCTTAAPAVASDIESGSARPPRIRRIEPCS